jgi:DNA polymerase
MNEPKAEIDFETRSGCNLKSHGTWRYAIHPSTEILCLVYRLPYWEAEKTAYWHPAIAGVPEHLDIDSLTELFDWIDGGGLVEAHGVWFEFCIWLNILVTRFGWPAIPLQQWRCSGAKAASHALPRGLEDAADALHLEHQKDMAGNKVMKKMTKPRKSRKKERETWAKTGEKPPKYLWHENADMLAQVIAYCRMDVLTESDLSASLPDLNEQETQLFLMDLELNLRGFQLDMEAVATALKLIRGEQSVLNKELSVLTKGQVKRATQRARMIAWFSTVGYELPNTQAATIDEALESSEEMSPVVRRALEIVRDLGRSSTKKYQAMKDWAARDGRIRGGLLYHGASTGRWSGKGVQPHNFPKPSFKADMDELWTVLKNRNRPEIASRYKSVMEALATALRGAIVARKGHTLYVADYAAIEARVLAWLADDQDALDIFREGRCPYCAMATDIYKFEVLKAEHPHERAVGKVAELGLGYQMGASKFQATCAKFGIEIDEGLASEVVELYRAKHPKIKAMWYEQEQTAIDAMHAGNEGRILWSGRIGWRLEGSYLYCILPSGRRLAYPYPQLTLRRTPWGDVRYALSFMGINSLTHQWQRQWTYGGCLVENITQATARDIMAYGMLNCEASGVYKLVLSVHDEDIAEAPLGEGSVDEFVQLMTTLPDWAEDCPIEAEGWSGVRYHK